MISLGNTSHHSTQRRCATPSCSKPAAAHRSICHGCRKRLWIERNPEYYLYDTLRWHARCRRKVFTLTFEQFQAFCAKTGYAQRKGTEPESLTIDRIESARGYEADNIRVLTHAANSWRRDAPAPEASAADMAMGADPFG